MDQISLRLGRAFGVIAAIALAPAIGLLVLALAVLAGPRLLTGKLWNVGSRRVQTLRLITPESQFGHFLRTHHLDHLPLLLDIAAGRAFLLVEWGWRRGLSVELLPASPNEGRRGVPLSSVDHLP